MSKVLVAIMIALLPLSAFAQSQPAQPTVVDANSGWGRTAAITVGVVGGIVVADLLSGGSLTGSVLETVGLRSAAAPAAAAAARAPLSPALAEARAAGAVLGEQILPATELRDAAARRDMLYAGIIGTGAVIGGWLVSQFAR